MASSLSFYEMQLAWVVQSRGCWILQVSACSATSPPQCAIWTVDTVRTCRQIQRIHDWQMRVCRNQVRSSWEGAFIWNIELCTNWKMEWGGEKLVGRNRVNDYIKYRAHRPSFSGWSKAATLDEAAYTWSEICFLPTLRFLHIWCYVPWCFLNDSIAGLHFSATKVVVLHKEDFVLFRERPTRHS